MFSIERTLGPQKIATLALGLLKGEGGHAYAKTSLRYNTSDACPIQLGALFAREGFSRLIHCSTTFLNTIASFKISSASVYVETNA
jgi:hypothetical protein